MEEATLLKKRSIFRSPGTASSPDLATLVRRAKEAKGKSPMSTSVSQASVRDRSVSTIRPMDEVRSIASGSTERTAQASETSSRRRQNSEEGFKVGIGVDDSDARVYDTKPEVYSVGCLE